MNPTPKLDELHSNIHEYGAYSHLDNEMDNFQEQRIQEIEDALMEVRDILKMVRMKATE